MGGAFPSIEEAVSLMEQPDGSAGAAVWPQAYVLALARPSGLVAVDAEERDQAVLVDGYQAADPDDDDDDEAPCHCANCQREEESEEESEDDGEEFYDSEDEDEESDGEVDVPLKIDADEAAEASCGGGSQPPLAGRRVVIPEGRFLQTEPRFAFTGSAAGFMRVAVVEPPADRQAAESDEQGGGKQILVLYRYTQFSAASGAGVEVCGSTKQHQLQFVVPPAGDAASSLPWAGSSLGPLIYPVRQSKELQALWSRLVSEVVIPPRATRVQVIADVGILRREDRTPRRMERVRTALEDLMGEPWRGYHVAMELQLPEPVDLCAEEAEAGEGEDTECERPTKRRKISAESTGQECPVCFDLLESGVAMWPGCSLPHVFHGACLEHTLQGSEMCPICRRKLSAQASG